MSERDIYEVANQLGGYVGPGTEKHLAAFLIREANEASKLADRIEALERENAELRETNRKLHRRCQQAERVHAMTVGYLSNWLAVLRKNSTGRPRPDRLLFCWAIQDLHRKANSASRALPTDEDRDAKERKR